MSPHETHAPSGFPSFAELPVRPDAPAGSSWGVFGGASSLGTLNFIGGSEVAFAAGLVETGEVIPVNLSVSAPDPVLFHRVHPTRTQIVLNHGESLDDYLDRFYPHSSTHWDSLSHYADVEHGFYDGVTLEALTTGDTDELSVHHWAERGIVGRAVLIDVPRALARDSVSYNPLEYFPVTVDLVRRVAAQQGVGLRHGDILLIRTGWLETFGALSDADRNARVESSAPPTPGMYGTEVPAFLWDNRIAAVASDTPVFEAQPGGDRLDLALHKALIARLGMPVGENWDLARLAESCARDGRYAFLLTSAPLNITHGRGTPANALAVK